MRLLTPIAILLILAACNTSKHTVTKRAPFAAKPITIDGNDTDWPSPYPYYDSKAMVSYACTNDRSNLYISIKASDARIRAKILRGGMTVSIDTLGGKDQQLFIHAPMPDAILQGGEGARTRRQSLADGSQQESVAAARKQVMLRAAEYSLDGFGACDGNYTGNDTGKACGIRVKMDINDYNELVWEAAIPFAAWHHRTLITRDGGKHISICIEVAGIKLPARSTGGGRQGGFSGGGGGMGGMRGGGMGGGRGGGMGGRTGGGRGAGGQAGAADEGAAMSESTRTWLVTGLAYQ